MKKKKYKIKNKKWIFKIIFLIISIFIFFLSIKNNFLVTLKIIAILLLTISIVINSKNSFKIIELFKKIKQEFKKIVWPNKKETLQTTLIICLVTILTSFLIWGLDNILFYITSFLI